MDFIQILCGKPNLFEKDIKMSILQGELFVECVKFLVNDVSG